MFVVVQFNSFSIPYSAFASHQRLGAAGLAAITFFRPNFEYYGSCSGDSAEREVLPEGDFEEEAKLSLAILLPAKKRDGATMSDGTYSATPDAGAE